MTSPTHGTRFQATWARSYKSEYDTANTVGTALGASEMSLSSMPRDDEQWLKRIRDEDSCCRVLDGLQLQVCGKFLKESPEQAFALAGNIAACALKHVIEHGDDRLGVFILTKFGAGWAVEDHADRMVMLEFARVHSCANTHALLRRQWGM